MGKTRLSPQERRSLLQSRGLSQEDMENFQRDYASLHTPGMAVKHPKSGTTYVVGAHGEWRKVKHVALKDYIGKKMELEAGVRLAAGTTRLRNG